MLKCKFTLKNCVGIFSGRIEARIFEPGTHLHVTDGLLYRKIKTGLNALTFPFIYPFKI